MSLSVLVSDSNFCHYVNTDDATAVVVHFAFGANIHERKKKDKKDDLLKIIKRPPMQEEKLSKIITAQEKKKTCFFFSLSPFPKFYLVGSSV